jgi:hypothetical protein
MERVEIYCNCIKHLLEEHSKFNKTDSDIESEIFSIKTEIDIN